MTLAIPLESLLALLYASTRVGVVLYFLPLLGGAAAPAPVRVLLSLALGIVLAPWTPVTLPVHPLGLFLALGREAVIGFVIGFLCQLLLMAPRLAGDILAQEMGLRLAQEVDPNTRIPVTPTGRLYEVVLLLVFLSVHGHHDVVRALHLSFQGFPVGATSLPVGLPVLVGALDLCMRAALLIAAPLFVVLLIGSLALALLAKAVPQLHILNFGYPLRLVGSLAMAGVLLPFVMRPGLQLLESLKRSLVAVVGG